MILKGNFGELVEATNVHEWTALLDSPPNFCKPPSTFWPGSTQRRPVSSRRRDSKLARRVVSRSKSGTISLAWPTHLPHRSRTEQACCSMNDSNLWSGQGTSFGGLGVAVLTAARLEEWTAMLDTALGTPVTEQTVNSLYPLPM